MEGRREGGGQGGGRRRGGKPKSIIESLMKEGRTTWAKNDLASAIILRDPPKTPVRVSEPKSNTRYHRFLWKEEDDEEITANQTNRLTAGDRPSLFIAIKTLEDTS